eukprot:1158554-Pelagomonas_calceolata.AAC.6
MLRCQILWRGTGGACWWGDRLGRVWSRKEGPPPLAYAASCRPPFGTELWWSTMLLLQVEWAASVAWLKIGIGLTFFTLSFSRVLRCAKKQ